MTIALYKNTVFITILGLLSLSHDTYTHTRTSNIHKLSHYQKACLCAVKKAQKKHCCKGKKGKKGKHGKRGKRGKPGITGQTGAPGAPGATGPTGASGTGGILGYAFVYNQSKLSIPQEFDVSFDNNGPMTTGITHVVDTPYIRVANAGVYKVAFTIFGTNDSQFSLAVNDTPLDSSTTTANLPNTVFTAGKENKQINGQAILSLSANDVVTVRNHTSEGKVKLKENGKHKNINASIVIEQIA